MPSRVTAVFLIAGLVDISAALPANGQQPERPAFEVAAIRSARGGSGNFIDIAPGGERLTATNAPLKLLIMMAYGVGDRQISGGPNWLNSECYDIEAKPESPVSRERILQMLQTLLADRFHLEMHKENRQVPIYVLTVDGRVAFGLHENKSGESPRLNQGNNGQVVFQSYPLAQLVWFLSLRLRSDVIDRTELKGSYDFVLTYQPETPSPGNIAASPFPGDSPRPPLSEAVRDQLGLRLQPEKASSDVFVIDHAEKPSGN